MSFKLFFHFVPMGNTIWRIFSPDDNVVVLCSIGSANDIMMVESIGEAWGVASLGFFVP